MKRGTVGHIKVADLCGLLKIERWGAVGILETLWHTTSERACQGDIGRLEDREIAFYLGWSGDPTALIDALVSAGWIDRSDEYRLLVHDWHDHADDATTKRAIRLGGFLTASGGRRPPPAADGDERREAADNGGQRRKAADTSAEKRLPDAGCRMPDASLPPTPQGGASVRVDRKTIRLPKPSANGTHAPPAWINDLPDSPPAAIVRLVAGLWRGVADWSADEATAFLSGIPPNLTVDDVKPRLVKLRNSNEHRWPERGDLIKLFREIEREKRKVLA